MSNVNALVCLIIVVFGVIVVNGSSLNKEEVGIYELNKGDFSVKFTNWGATIISVFLPDKDGIYFSRFPTFNLISIICFV